MKKALPVILSMLFLAACVGADIRSDPALTGPTWQLVSYGSIESPIPALAGVDAYMEFNRDGTGSGNVGCNNFLVEYRISGGRLEFGEIISPLMEDCGINKLMEQEAIVLGALIGRLEYKISGATLTIWLDSSSMPALVFRKK